MPGPEGEVGQERELWKLARGEASKLTRGQLRILLQALLPWALSLCRQGKVKGEKRDRCPQLRACCSCTSIWKLIKALKQGNCIV